MTYFDLSQYNPLSQYAVLAGSGITGGSTSNPTIIYNGFWGTSSSTNQGTIQAGGVYPNGENNNPEASHAIEQLSCFMNELYYYTLTLPSSPIGIHNVEDAIMFYPNINYCSPSIATFTSCNLIFDAQNNPNAQFFISVCTDLTLNT